jgi:4-diphosphocytidyl-2-C-methyl-D-erythritol kinase
MACPPKRPATTSSPRRVWRAPAKVNLYLHILGRRPDGYHELDSLVAFASVSDMLSVAPADALELKVEGPFAAQAPANESNLVLRAARALAAEAGVEPRASLVLCKNLPAAAGLGGGSADAAATLRALSALWNLQLPQGRMADLALALGADVPVCLHGRPAFVGGIGERLAPAPPLPAAGVLLASPGIQLPTYSVFRRFSGPLTMPARFMEPPRNAGELAELLAKRRNDLEAAARQLAPAIADALARLAALPGALLARMTGSGAACFAIFPSRAQASRGAEILRAAEPEWWTAAGAFEGGPWDTERE